MNRETDRLLPAPPGSAGHARPFRVSRRRRGDAPHPCRRIASRLPSTRGNPRKAPPSRRLRPLDRGDQDERSNHRVGRLICRPIRPSLGCRSRLLLPPRRLGARLCDGVGRSLHVLGRPSLAVARGQRLRTTGERRLPPDTGEGGVRGGAIRSRDGALPLPTRSLRPIACKSARIRSGFGRHSPYAMEIRAPSHGAYYEITFEGRTRGPQRLMSAGISILS